MISWEWFVILNSNVTGHSISFHKQRAQPVKYQHLGTAPLKNGTYLKYLANQNQPQTVNTSNLIQVINDFEIN